MAVWQSNFISVESSNKKLRFAFPHLVFLVINFYCILFFKSICPYGLELFKNWPFTINNLRSSDIVPARRESYSVSESRVKRWMLNSLLLFSKPVKCNCVHLPRQCLLAISESPSPPYRWHHHGHLPWNCQSQREAVHPHLCRLCPEKWLSVRCAEPPGRLTQHWTDVATHVHLR